MANKKKLRVTVQRTPSGENWYAFVLRGNRIERVGYAWGSKRLARLDGETMLAQAKLEDAQS